MAVPEFQSFMLPLLKDFADGQEHSLVGLRARLAEEMALSKEDLTERLPSGTQARWLNRVAWAASYLRGAGCLERIRPGVFKMTTRGKEVLLENHQKITIKLLDRFPEFKSFRQGKAPATGTSAASPANPNEADETRTPEEMLESGFQALQGSLANEVLDAVKKMSPEAFEQLVVKLLVAMGYGGSLEDAGRAVGKAGDEGIDGIIKEDKLGLDSVYIQAKKWGSVVGRPDVQRFAGSLEGQRPRRA